MRRWQAHCVRYKVDTTAPTVRDVLVFLGDLHTQGVKYGVIASTRSALSAILHIPGVPSVGKHPLVRRLMKGIYNTNPPVPRYAFVWDSTILIDYLKSVENFVLNFEQISKKAVTLLTILSYLKQREMVLQWREENSMFLITREPFNAAKDTLSRWIKDLMKDSGIDIDTFKPHTRV